ncbi:MAG TPA: SprT family zinc-dependent metalloprotease [Smithella sp.]|nr:SprT family zinc-dependent metalloprotease [Smithella sp.]HOG90849.1 SprT family zinc-dependent metalloprotease [Smithella sp.]
MDINYRITRSKKRKKTISLQVRGESEIIVSAPCFTSAAEISRFVEEKQQWINKIIRKQKDDALKNKVREYQTGEHFLYLGQSYPLDVFFEPFENAGVVFWNNRFYLNAPNNKELKKYYFVSWYKKKAAEYINQRIIFYSRILKLHPEKIRITSAESRWGSCSEDDHLAFSFRLIMAPPAIIDYVIVHELAHIKEKNHSSNFWQVVASVIAEYKQHRRWLRENHQIFNI